MYLLYIRGLHGGADTAFRETEAFRTDGDISMKCKEKTPFSRGAYSGVRNPQNYPTETFFGGDPSQGAFDTAIREIARGAFPLP